MQDLIQMLRCESAWHQDNFITVHLSRNHFATGGETRSVSIGHRRLCNHVLFHPKMEGQSGIALHVSSYAPKSACKVDKHEHCGVFELFSFFFGLLNIQVSSGNSLPQPATRQGKANRRCKIFTLSYPSGYISTYGIRI